MPYHIAERAICPGKLYEYKSWLTSWLAFALTQRTRTGIRNRFWKYLQYFLLEKPHMHKKKISFFETQEYLTHTTDTSFTLVSLYFSRSVVAKRYTVLESFMIYKWSFIFGNLFTSQGSADCDSYPVSVLISSFICFFKQCIFKTLELALYLHCSSIICCYTDMLSVLYFIHIWFTVVALYVNIYNSLGISSGFAENYFKQHECICITMCNCFSEHDICQTKEWLY